MVVRSRDCLTNAAEGAEMKQSFFPISAPSAACGSFCLSSVAQAAEFLVVDQLVNRRVIAADRAGGIAPQIERVDLHRERIEVEQTAHQSLAFAKDDLDRLERFDHADQSR